MLQYRFKALEKAREPEELDAAVRLTRPRAWIAVFVVLVAAVAGLGWAFLGTVPRTLSGSGLLVHPLGTVTLQSTATGIVRDVLVQPGQEVPAGAVVASVEGPAGGPPGAVTAPFEGEVTDVAVGAGQVVGLGSPIVTVARTRPGSADVVGVVFVSSAAGPEIHTGMPVTFDVGSAPAREYGLLRGRVVEVGEAPVSSAQILALVGNAELTRTLVRPDAPLMVRVEPTADPSERSGLAWTTRTGPPFPLSAETLVEATVHVADERPAERLFGSE